MSVLFEGISLEMLLSYTVLLKIHVPIFQSLGPYPDISIYMLRSDITKTQEK